MSGVVLRCPSCGTTQSHPGECDACSEGNVRYFCSNHPEGIWLEEPVCQACGARFGQRPVRVEPLPSAPPLAGRRTHPPATRVPARHSTEPSRTELGRGVPTASPSEEVGLPPLLADVIKEMMDEGERSRYRLEEAAPAEPVSPAPSTSVPLVGCLGRVLLFVLLLIALVVFGVFLLVGGALQGFL